MICGVACNVNVTILGKKISISTPEYLSQYYKDHIEELGDYTGISEDYNNQKAMSYNMIVVQKNNNFGVINNNKETIIGTKYNTMEFNEKTNTFIVSTNNKYGIITTEGKVKIPLKYDGIRIIKYSPVLYEVKLNNLYGVIDEKGDTVVEIKYKSLGTISDNKNSLEGILFIKNIEGENTGIVVCSEENKYGIINLSTKENFLECNLDKIYTKPGDNENIYYVQFNNMEYTLAQYIQYINTMTVAM